VHAFFVRVSMLYYISRSGGGLSDSKLYSIKTRRSAKSKYLSFIYQLV